MCRRDRHDRGVPIGTEAGGLCVKARDSEGKGKKSGKCNYFFHVHSGLRLRLRAVLGCCPGGGALGPNQLRMRMSRAPIVMYRDTDSNESVVMGCDVTCKVLREMRRWQDPHSVSTGDGFSSLDGAS